MAVNGTIQLGYKNNAWFTANASLVLLVGQIVYLEQTGTYKLGDGVTALSALTFLGGGSGGGVQSVTGSNVDNTDPLNPIIQDFIISPSGERRVDVTDFHVELRASELGDVSTVTVLPTSIDLDSISVTKNGVEIATVNDIDTKQNKPIIVSTSITAILDSEYVMNATSTFTDPTPSEGKGFTVFVLNGTATVGGVTYSVVGTIIKRFYHSGSWLNEVYFDRSFYDTVYLPITIPQTTGVALTFVTDSVYGTIGTPETGNITYSSTNAKLGVTNLIIHNHTVAPTFGTNMKKLSGSGNYLTSNINYIYVTYINSTEVIYNIQQRV